MCALVGQIKDLTQPSCSVEWKYPLCYCGDVSPFTQHLIHRYFHHSGDSVLLVLTKQYYGDEIKERDREREREVDSACGAYGEKRNRYSFWSETNFEALKDRIEKNLKQMGWSG